MELVRELLVVLHLIGMAAIVGGWLAVLGAPRVLPAILWGARAQFVTGILLWGILESGVLDGHDDPDRVKLTVKFLVAFVLTGLAEANAKRGDAVNPRIVHAIGALGVLNVAIAILWN
jgi:thiamine transporter ThiT